MGCWSGSPGYILVMRMATSSASRINSSSVTTNASQRSFTTTADYALIKQ